MIDLVPLEATHAECALRGDTSLVDDEAASAEHDRERDRGGREDDTDELGHRWRPHDERDRQQSEEDRPD